MNYSDLVNSVRGISCILSLRKSADNGSDEITITAANKDYLASVNKLDEEFVPNRPYTYYIVRDTNFEALAVNCITAGKISHQYVNAGLYEAWLDIYMIPLEKDEEGNGYCLFSYEMTQRSDAEKMVKVSVQTAYSVLKTCIRFRENNGFKETLDSIVKDLRHQCDSFGCAIILMDTAERKIDIMSFDSAGSFAPADKDVFFKPEFYDIVERWRDIMGGSNCFIIPSEDKLKEVEKKDVHWYASLVLSGVKNLVLYPLRVNDNLYGYIFATNFNPDRTHFIREVMEINSFVLSAEVENYRMRERLEKLSRTDMLTGVLNRNAMNKMISDLDSCEIEFRNGLGVVFVDVNGLKTVNDTQGHNEGDKILVNVSDKLKSVFDQTDIYRAGGDEFLIITDMERYTFYAAFEKLRSLSRVEGEPSFALGAHYDGTEMNIKKTMRIADSNMYENKAEYYQLNPGKDRRTH